MSATADTEPNHAPKEEASNDAVMEQSDDDTPTEANQEDHTTHPAKEEKRGVLSSVGGIIKGHTKHITLTNLVCLYTLSGVLTGGGGKDVGAGSTHQPQLQQHFTWEHIGYIPSVLVTPAPQVTPPPASQRPGARRYAGYYSKDKIAMKKSLLSIPPRPKQNEQSQEETKVRRKESEIHKVISTEEGREETKVCRKESEINKVNFSTIDEALEEEEVCCKESESHKANFSSTIDQALEEEFKEEATDTEEGIAGTKTPSQSQSTNRIQSALSSSVVVLDLTLGVNPTKEVAFARSAVTFLIGVTRESKSSSLEVLVRLQSDGGQVETYGLLAEQFRRLRQEPSITLTIACDVAALSGGYMVASLASPGQLLASPFASIGSIGVVNGASGLSFRDALEAYGIKEVRVKSGERKASGGGLTGLTEQEIQFQQERTDATHRAFRDHVRRWRGDSIDDIDFVASGDHWLGVNAIDHGLVDRLITSDEYLDNKMQEGYNVLRLKEYGGKKGGLLGGGGDGGEKSWFWILFDLVFPPGEGDNQAMVDTAMKEHGRSLDLAARVLRTVLGLND